MTAFRHLAGILLSMVVATGLVAILGCELEDASSSGGIDISPDSKTLDVGEVSSNLVFSAMGGSGSYTWKVDDESLGTIVGAGGTAIYTTTTNLGQNYITVTDSSSNSVTATVTQN